MNILKRLRANKELSLSELAALAKVDQSTISMLENDRQKGQLKTLAKLAKALEVDIEVLLPLLDTGASDRGRRSADIRRGQTDKLPGGTLAAISAPLAPPPVPAQPEITPRPTSARFEPEKNSVEAKLLHGSAQERAAISRAMLKNRIAVLEGYVLRSRRAYADYWIPKLMAELERF